MAWSGFLISGVPGSLEYFQEFLEEYGVIVPGSGGNQVGINDTGLCQIGPAKCGDVEFTLGNRGRQSTL